jgi:ubiquinone/menaquinone biosynthesis C-methylase UbiE
MVGCGNSRMSEEMARSDAKYRNMTNIDISPIVLEKMKEHQDKIVECHNFSYAAMDATKMDYRQNTFDICIDKGTYDALACNENDKSMIRNLYLEMIRVTKHAVVIITNGTPEKRMNDFKNFSA